MNKIKRFLIRILRIFGIKFPIMSKISVSDDFTIVKIEDVIFKRTSLKGARIFREGEMLTDVHYYIKVLLHNDKFSISYADMDELKEDFKKLGNLMEGKLKVVDKGV